MNNFTRVKVTYPKRTLYRQFDTFCRKCKKKLKRSISRVYFVNGFHDEQKTIKKYNAELDKEMAEKKKKGVLCQKCEE